MGTHIAVKTCHDNLESGVGNLLEVFAKASELELTAGKLWYASAHADAVRIANLYGLPLATVVKVACALSPRLSWERNMPAAEDVIRHYVSGGYIPDIARYVGGEKLQRTRHDMTAIVISDDTDLPFIAGPTRVNIVKALWVLQGHDWVLRGKKVNSFLDNILNHATSQSVTVDSHAIQVWFGNMTSGTYAVPPSFYSIVEADYRRAAALVSLTPLQFQAVVWLVKKRLSPRRAKATKGIDTGMVYGPETMESFMARNWSDDPAVRNAAMRERLSWVCVEA